ncbi:hypothetical protein NOF04DRAFT_1411583 [Fusarium oxysporum II5]|nr:hypothetical protein NOF04DRAFT_1411583 [Fusarium oxysporum II5]
MSASRDHYLSRRKNKNKEEDRSQGETERKGREEQWKVKRSNGGKKEKREFLRRRKARRNSLGKVRSVLASTLRSVMYIMKAHVPERLIRRQHLQGLAPGEMEQDWMPQGPAAVNHLSSIALPITKSLSRSIFTTSGSSSANSYLSQFLAECTVHWPPGAEEQKRFSCLSKEGRRLHWRWSEGHVSVLKHDSSAGRSPNPLFQTSLVYVTQLFPTSATAVKGFLGVCVPEREFSLKLDATLDDSKTRSIRSLVNWAKTAQYIEPGTIKPRLSCNRGTHELSPKKGPRTSKIQPSFAAETPLQHGDVLPCITPRQNASTYYCMLIFDIISAAIACCPTHMNPDRRCDVEQRANQGYRGEHLNV